MQRSSFIRQKVIRLTLVVALLLSSFMVRSSFSSLRAAEQIQSTESEVVPSADGLALGIRLYQAQEYEGAINHFAQAVAYFDLIEDRGQAALARRYLQNAQTILDRLDPPESSLPVAAKRAAIPEQEDDNQTTATPVPSLFQRSDNASGAIGSTDELTSTESTTMGTPLSVTEVISDTNEGGEESAGENSGENAEENSDASSEILTTTNDSSAPETIPATELVTTTTAAEEITPVNVASEAPSEQNAPSEQESTDQQEEPVTQEEAPVQAPPIIISPIICPIVVNNDSQANADDADENPSEVELTDYVTSFVENGDQLSKDKLFDEAIISYCNGLAILLELPDAMASANTLAKLAEAYKGIEQDAETLATYREAARLYQQLDQPNPAGNVLTSLGRYQRSTKRIPEAIATLEAALSLYRETDNKARSAAALTQLVEAYKAAEQDGNVLIAYNEAIALYRQLENLGGAAGALEAFARYESAMERFSSAITLLDQALALRSELGDENPIANTNKQLADTYLKNGNEEEAFSFYDEAIARYQAADNLKSAAGVLEAIARHHTTNEAYAQAIDVLTEAVALRDEVGDDKAMATTLKQLADVTQKSGDEAQAILIYEEIVALYEELDQGKKAAALMEVLARIEVTAERWATAIERYEQAVTIYRALEDDEATANALSQLAKTHQKAGNESQMIAASEEAAELYEEAGESEKAAAALIPTQMPTPTATPTAFEVTPTPKPENLFEAATLVAQQTSDALEFGTPTPLPKNYVVLKPTRKPKVATFTPTAVNEATAAVMIAEETAIAMTTGTPFFVTPTPKPENPEEPGAAIVYITPTTKPATIFGAATVSAQLTAEVQANGTSTPLPPNWKVARVALLPNLSDYENSATAVALVALSTAIAQTTGTPEGLVYWTATPKPPKQEQQQQFVYVTPTPKAKDVFAAATVSAQLTANAQSYGTPTSLPADWKVARVAVLPNLSDYDNRATAIALAAKATAIAQTTGTPEGLVYWTATPKPKVTYVTPTPPAADIYGAATVAAQATANAQAYGTVTPLPDNWRVARVSVRPNLTDYENQATAVALVAFSTAIAQTTGEPEGFVAWTATPRPTRVPGSGRQPTAVFLSADSLTATPTPTTTPVVPGQLVGKILFLSDMEGGRRPVVYAMNPDGSNLIKLTSDEFYKRSIERNRSSADKRYRAINCGDRCEKRGRLQIWYIDNEWNSQSQMTFFGRGGRSWDMVWSPTDTAVAFVDNQTGNDEIYVVRHGEWPAKQLTNNDWQWDHHPTWSPDGKQIVFASNRDIGRRQLWIMDADGGNKRRITDFPGEAYNPVWVLYGDD